VSKVWHGARQRTDHMPEGLRYAIDEMTEIKLLVLNLS
jgi:hypothetical protein